MACREYYKIDYKSELLNIESDGLLDDALLNHHLPPAVQLLQLGPVLEEKLFLDHPGQLNQQLRHFVVVVYPRGLGLQQLGRQNAGEALLVHHVPLLLAHLGQRKGAVAPVEYDASHQ